MTVRMIDADALLDDLQELLNQEVIGNTVSDVGNGIALAMQRVMAAEETTLNTLRDAVYEDAVAHGLWESTDDTVQLILYSIKPADRTTYYRDKITREWATKIISLEIDELLASSEYEADYADELADVIIASLSVAGKLGIDIDAQVRRKMEINRHRPWKHGKEPACNT